MYGEVDCSKAGMRRGYNPYLTNQNFALISNKLKLKIVRRCLATGLGLLAGIARFVKLRP
jgi:hypothetical protein